MLSASANWEITGLVISQHCHVTFHRNFMQYILETRFHKSLRIMSIIPIEGEKLRKWQDTKPYYDLPISSSPCCSSLLPTLRLPPLGIKSENTRGNKYYVKEGDSWNSGSRKEDWVWKVYILTEPASDCLKSEETGRTYAREKILYNYMVQRQCLKTFEQFIWPSNCCLRFPVDLFNSSLT